jgi:hypothetical protein
MRKVSEKEIENEKRVEEFKRKLDEHEQAEAAKGRVFDPKALFNRANTIVTVEDPVLGQVKYSALTLEDSFEFNGIADRKERTIMVAYLMLKKAYPELTLEMVKKMPLKEANALMDIVAAQPCFLSPLEPQSKNGLKTTGKRRK